MSPAAVPALGQLVGTSDRLKDAWRHAGGALVWPLVLVVVSGFVVLFAYTDDPQTSNDRMAQWPAWLHFVRGLHLYSSRALLLGAIVHLLWTWYARRVGGPYASAYLVGVGLFALLGAAHLTGHALRWGPASFRIADYQRAVLPPGVDVYQLQLPLHVAIFTGVAGVMALVHVGLLGRGYQRGVERAFPGGWNRLHTGLGMGLVVVIALAALLRPAPLAQDFLPWPLAPFEAVAVVLEWTPAFVLSILLTVGLLALPPRLVSRPWALRTVQGLVVAILALAVVPPLYFPTP
jgi:hypothetical protein